MCVLEGVFGISRSIRWFGLCLRESANAVQRWWLTLPGGCLARCSRLPLGGTSMYAHLCWQWRKAAWQRFGSGARQIPGRQEMFDRKER
jgi:hypothetical protein